MGGLHLLLIICFFSFHLPSSNFATNETDKLALLAFKSHVSNGPSRPLSSWNDSFHYCQWQGVRCSNRHPDRVTVLSLGSLSLSGSISPSLANLTFLKSLNLSDNQLTGNIPSELGHLSRLKFLDLSVNNLDGNIPSTLGNCSNLDTLNLYRNNLTKTIPSTLGNLTHLFDLKLRDNNLDGFIPPSLGQLKALEYLSLSENYLSGKIPHSIYNLSAMISLSLSVNQLDGNLPSNFCDAFQNLQIIAFYKNQFNGQIPISISNCSSMTMIDLSSNNFRGTIPNNIGTLQNLFWFDLSSNQLKATDEEWRFFDSLINCTFLQLLDLADNQLQGMLPGSIANLSTSLEYLSLLLNPISGNIPAEIGKLTNLITLGLGQTFIEGTIPKEIGNLWNLEGLGLNGNMLSGNIPSTLGNLTKMNVFHLENNAFTGSIPEELSNMQLLNALNLSNNQLIGSIPKKLFNLHSLSISLDLSNNYLNGSVPPEIGHLNNVAKVYLSNNKLSGQIPSTIDGCQLLQILHLDGNQFNGSIPFSLSKMIGLQDLDISNNAFSGPVPEFVGQMKLQHLNICFNNFEGELPKDGVFRNASAVDIRGNSKLCGGVPEMHLPKCILYNQKKKHNSKIIMVIIFCIGGIICLCIIMFLIAHFCCKKGSYNNPLPLVAENSDYQKVSYNDILRATNNFSLENLIGRGSFGDVYKALMNFENMSTVAVKVLNLKQLGASRSFFSECGVLRKVRHRNLMKVLSLCSTTDHHGNDFKALIFELMPNGSLETWLHPDACTNRQFRSLSLIKRLNIATDVATALDYLHNHGPTPIVHCDLKPSNVLLDEDMTAHVGDFGLARFLVQTDSMSSLLIGSTDGLRGSIGYIPPEYGMGGKASVEGDAYSFGILLLEMFTGVSPTDKRFKDGLSLHNYVQMAFSDRFSEVIDHKLFLTNDGGENANAEDVHNCLVSVIRCGLMCSKLSPKERNGIKEVVKELNWARMKLAAEIREIKSDK